MDQINVTVRDQWPNAWPNVMVCEVQIEGMPETFCLGYAWPGRDGKVRVVRTPVWTDDTVARLWQRVSEIEERNNADRATQADEHELRSIVDLLQMLDRHSIDDVPSDYLDRMAPAIAEAYRRHFPGGVPPHDPEAERAIEGHFGVRDWIEQ
jgi:hypothetical protein